MPKEKTNKDQPKRDKKPKVNPELEGFNIEIDSFGEIKSTYDIDKINRFLNENVEDKKLEGREGFKSAKKDDKDSK